MPRDEVALEEGEYWASDLEGCAVVDGDVAIGFVRRMSALPSCEVLEVDRADGSELLVPNGAMLLQAITIDDRAYEVEKASRSFMNTHIFPGGCLPSLEAIARGVARRTDLQIVGLEDLTPHYVETLRRWRRRFLVHAGELAALGYDERFRRLWTLYLCYCEAGFAERRILDQQLVLCKPRHRVEELVAVPSPASAVRALP